MAEGRKDCLAEPCKILVMSMDPRQLPNPTFWLQARSGPTSRRAQRLAVH